MSSESDSEIGQDEYIELIEKLDRQLDNSKREIIEKDIKIKYLDQYIKEVEDENVELHNKSKLYQKVDGVRQSKLTNMLSNIGKSVPQEFYKESEERFKKYIEDRKREQQRRKQ